MATLNAGKSAELARLLGHLPVELISLRDWPGATLPPESRESYAANAVGKATAADYANAYRKAAPGKAVIV